MNDDLIKRLEAAKGPSRELDAFIGVTLKYPSYKHGKSVPNQKPDTYMEAWSRLAWDGLDGHYPLAHFTSSIDAALTLLPPDEKWPDGDLCFDIRVEHGRWTCDLTCLVPEGGDCGRSSPLYVHANTAALAICIAALRAIKGDRR